MRLPILAVLPSALLACGGSAPSNTGPDPAAAAEVAARLCTVFTKAGHACEHEGVTARAVGRTVTVGATLEKEATVPGSVMLDLAYDLRVDDTPVPALSTRFHGTGRDLDAARAKAASDWASVYGAAIVDRLVDDGRLTALQALQDDQEPPPAFSIGGWSAYPGWTYLNGGRKDKMDIIRIRDVLGALAPAIGEWEVADGATHAVLVHLEIRDGYAPEGECTMDGEPAPRICELALTYDWPEPAPSYVLRQYFVFAPAKAGGEPGEPSGGGEAEG